MSASPAVTLGKAPWLLELREVGKGLARRFLMGAGQWTCGRNPLADLVLKHASVSDQHLRLDVGVERATVTDLESTNGTFVDGRRIEGEEILRTGVALRVGAIDLVVRVGPADSVVSAVRPVGVVGNVCVRGLTTEPFEIPLEQRTYTVGRAPQCDIVIRQHGVSRRHAKLVVSTDGITVEDLGSSNGSYFDGSRLTKPVKVPWGSLVVLGDSRLDFHEASLTGLSREIPLELTGEPTSPGPPRAVSTELLSDSPLSLLEKQDQTLLVSTAKWVILKPGQVLTQKGEQALDLFVVVEGELREERTDGVPVPGTSLRQGCVDFSAVLAGGAYARNLVAHGRAAVLKIPGSALLKCMERAPSLAESLALVASSSAAQRFQKIAAQYGVDPAIVKRLVLAMKRRAIRKGEWVQRLGDPCQALAIVDTGAVRVLGPGDNETAPVGFTGPGDLVGAAEILESLPYAHGYQAIADTLILEIAATFVCQAAQETQGIANLLRAFSPEPTGAENDEQALGPNAPVVDDDDVPLEHFLKSGSEPASRRHRTKPIIQHDQMDCAAACMAMVAQSYGRTISLSTYRSLIHVTREGASMLAIREAAKATGFEAIGVQAPFENLSEIHCPAILLTEYHFVVLTKATEGYVWVIDPGSGKRRISREAFEKQWQGIVLLLRPTPALFSYPESRPAYRKYLNIMRGSWWNSAELLLASVLLFAFGLVMPLFSQATFDKVLVERDVSLLRIMLFAIAAVTASQLVITSIRGYLIGFLANRIDTLFSALLYRHIMKLPLAFFAVRHAGDILARFGETSRIRQFLTGDTVEILIQLLSIVLYAAVLFIYNVKLGLLVVLLAPILASASAVLSKSLRRASNEYFVDHAKTNSFVIAHFRFLETIKSLGAEIPARWRWEAAMRRLLGTRFRLEKLSIVLNSVGSGLQQIALVTTLYVAATLAVKGDISIGQVIASGQLAALVFGPISTLARKWAMLQQTAVALGRLEDVFTVAPDPDTKSAPGQTSRLRGYIEFKNVWFQYGGDLSPWVIKDVSFSIRAGETIAIVGRSGSGKTTLVQMINRLYQPTRGKILIDGRDIESIPIKDLRAAVGIVMQDSYIFAGTIFDNITFGDDSPSMDLAIAAAKAANGHDFITRAKNGYMTELAEAGGGLSGGQKQRLNIARALYRKPSILIMDEATSSLDAETERGVVEAMRVFCRDRTSVIIAHRLSTVLRANRILFVEDGRVTEQGTHAELIAKNGKYASLFAAQLSL